MGAGLLGAIAGAGQGAIDKSDRMRQDTLMEEDNAIWEARQVRLSEIRGAEADQAQGRADASESARYARGMQDKKSLLAEQRKHDEGKAETEHMRNLASEGFKSSLRTAEKKAGMQEAVRLGGSPSGSGVGKSSSKLQSARNAAMGVIRTSLGINDYSEYSEDSEKTILLAAPLVDKYIDAGHPSGTAASMAFQEATGKKLILPEREGSIQSPTAEPKAMDKARSAAMEKMTDVQWLNTARAAAQRSPSKLMDIRGRLPEHLRAEFDQMTGNYTGTIQR